MGIITELISDIDTLNRENVLFHKNYESDTGTGWAQWQEYQEWINFNIASLDTITKLARENRYRDSYILLRPVLEAYLVIKLAMLGNIYFFDLLPKRNGAIKESKADLIARAKSDPNLNNSNTLKIKLIENDRGYRVRTFLRENPVQNTKEYVPRHYFIAKEYDSDTQYLIDLMNRNQWRGAKKIGKEYKKKHREMQEYYLSIGALIDFFEVNRFSTPRESKAIFVHYSFLSKFVHSTARGYESISNNRGHSYLEGIDDVFKQNDLHKLLILLYAVFLSLYFLELQLDYFGKESDLKIKKGKKRELQRLIKTIESKYSFFWFIFNKPHKFDVMQYRLKRQNVNNIDKSIAIPYYVNPLKRLSDLRSGWRNPVLGEYTPPEILRDL